MLIESSIVLLILSLLIPISGNVVGNNKEQITKKTLAIPPVPFSDPSHWLPGHHIPLGPVNSKLPYVPNVPSYRYTPDNVAAKAYRDLYYKNHQIIGRTKPGNLAPHFPNNRQSKTNGIRLMSQSSRLTPSVTSSLKSTPSTLTATANSVTITTSTQKPYSVQIDDTIGGSNEPLKKQDSGYSDMKTFQDLFSNLTAFPSNGDKIIKDIYGDIAINSQERQEQLKQMAKWMSGNQSPSDARSGPAYTLSGRKAPTINQSASDSMHIEHIAIVPKPFNEVRNANPKTKTRSTLVSGSNLSKPEALISSPPELTPSSSVEDDDGLGDDDDDRPMSAQGTESSGTLKTPPCGKSGRHYCIFKEDYPSKIVTEVTRYYKWPLEKLFRDLRNQVMPKLANDNYGGLVCDSITRVVRPGWARNTNSRWLVVINTDSYQQYVTEVICRHGSGSYCNFIPPCYHATCRQRYNTQKLLVIDPWNPYKGPFLSEFLFPSCCICHVSDDNSGLRKTHPYSASEQSTKLDGPHSSSLVEPVTEKIEL